MAAKMRTASGLAAEFIVIVVGVLVALAVDAFREDRAERIVAEQHLSGLETDLLVDSRTFEFMRERLPLKEASLRVLREVAYGRGELPKDDVGHLLRRSANYGWRIPQAQDATYEVLKSTGELRLIGDPDLQSSIVAYYSMWEHVLERLERHRSDWPSTSYGLVSSEVYRGGEALASDAARITERLRTPEVQEQLNHESNYLWILTRFSESGAEELSDLLRSVRSAPQD